MKVPILQIAARILLGVVFLYSGIIKWLNPAAFMTALATYKLFPSPVDLWVRTIIPPFEILLGATLILGIFLRQAAFCSCLLTLGFVTVLAQGIIRGLEIDCGCFGSSATTTVDIWWALLRALFLLGISATLYIYHHLSAQVPRSRS